MTPAQRVRRQSLATEKALQTEIAALKKGNETRQKRLDELEKEMDEINVKLRDASGALREAEKQLFEKSSLEADLEILQSRAETAETELATFQAEENTQTNNLQKLAEELQMQLENSKQEQRTRINELNRQYRDQYNKIKVQFQGLLDQQTEDIQAQLEGTHAKESKEWESDKAAMKEEVEKARDMMVEARGIKSKLAHQELLVREFESAKEDAEAKLLRYKAETDTRLDALRKDNTLFLAKNDELKIENRKLHHKIILKPEVKVYETLIRDAERTLDWGNTQPVKKRKLDESLASDLGALGDYSHTALREGRSLETTLSSRGLSTASESRFIIAGFANHANSGPWIQIKNSSAHPTSLEGWSLLFETDGADPQPIPFDAINVAPQQSVRMVTSETPGRQVGDIEISEFTVSSNQQVNVSLLDPDGKLAGGPLPLDVPSNDVEEWACLIM